MLPAGQTVEKELPGDGKTVFLKSPPPPPDVPNAAGFEFVPRAEEIARVEHEAHQIEVMAGSLKAQMVPLRSQWNWCATGVAETLQALTDREQDLRKKAPQSKDWAKAKVQLDEYLAMLERSNRAGQELMQLTQERFKLLRRQAELKEKLSRLERDSGWASSGY